MSKKQPEYHLQCQVCNYLEWQYPNVLFMTDTIAAVKLTLPQQVRNKKVQKNGFKCPDLTVFHPTGDYAGLFIELKAETPYKKDGTLKKNEHLEGQAATMRDLESKGYQCHFDWSFEQCKDIIDEYLKLERWTLLS